MPKLPDTSGTQGTPLSPLQPPMLSQGTENRSSKPVFLLALACVTGEALRKPQSP